VDEIAVGLPDAASRHAWSLGAAEQLSLQVLIRTRDCRTAFEIGTFNGGSTRLLAETLPQDGRVWTLDLPPAAFDDAQAPAGFVGSQVGLAYATHPRRRRLPSSSGTHWNTTSVPLRRRRTSC
jgi:hypothetical protein